MELRKFIVASVVLLASHLSREASAQESVKAAPAAAPAAAAAPAPAAGEEAAPAAAAPAGLKAVVRGLFAEARLGGGYMVLNSTIPDVNGNQASEGYGPGALVAFAFGYDISDMVALQAVGGTFLISGPTNRPTHVRDLGVLVAGAELRLAFDLSERLDLLVEAGAGYAGADNAIEGREDGIGILGGVGLEYYVHVRHFSVGLQITSLTTLNPTRVFIGLAPQLKYTFF